MSKPTGKAPESADILQEKLVATLGNVINTLNQVGPRIERTKRPGNVSAMGKVGMFANDENNVQNLLAKVDDAKKKVEKLNEAAHNATRSYFSSSGSAPAA